MTMETVHHFELQVAKHPNAIALVYREQSLTYFELNQLANNAAHALISQGMQNKGLIGVYLDRSPEMIISILAILKSGAGYLPLDTHYPKERLLYMMEDADVAALITTEERVLELTQTKPVFTITDLLKLKTSSTNPKVTTKRDDLIYVNYTSGSTGKPKGVAITHASVLHLLENPQYANLNSKTVMLQIAPAAFDAFTFELWGALLHGGKCVIHPEKLLTIHGLLDTINTHKVSVAFLTSALFNLIIDEAPTLFSKVSQILTGGEAHSIKHFRKALEALPNTEIIHVYGPTECTTFATFQKVTPQLALSDSIPIGHRIHQTELYVLDENHHQVPMGTTGELYIGGPGLAKKYLNAEALTKEKFIQNLPFLKDKQKIYKTGDLVVMLPNGALDYVGRIDNQVKIHGFRIELGEIESVLNAISEIKQAIVTVHTRGHHKKLAAFLVPKNQPLEKSTLLSTLRTHLPNYMIPSEYIWLDKMPLTPNGKIDRKALAALIKEEELAPQNL